MDSLRGALIQLSAWLDWLPNPVVALLILAIAAGLALALHHWAHNLARRVIEHRYPDLFSILVQLRGVSRLGLLILAMIIAIPAAPLGPATANLLAGILLVAVIALVGWAAIAALHIAVRIYLRHFQLDSEDNLLARKHNTQIRVLLRMLDILLVVVTCGAALMTLEPVRQFGVSLFASAGVAGIVVGIAARPVLSNLIAGVQLAMTQPIRLGDAVIVENEWGTVEEIAATYVVVRLWDWRRMIVPLTYFIEKPFQNWTRESAALIGTVLINMDYRAPVDAIRKKVEDIVRNSPLWDGRVVNVAVTDFKRDTMEVRCLASAATSGQAFDLRCEIREKLIDFLQKEYPEALPRQRAELIADTRTAVPPGTNPSSGRAEPGPE